jgi:hypothetical protein
LNFPFTQVIPLHQPKFQQIALAFLDAIHVSKPAIEKMVRESAEKNPVLDQDELWQRILEAKEEINRRTIQQKHTRRKVGWDGFRVERNNDNEIVSIWWDCISCSPSMHHLNDPPMQIFLEHIESNWRIRIQGRSQVAVLQRMLAAQGLPALYIPATMLAETRT